MSLKALLSYYLRVARRLTGPNVITLRPEGASKGNVLLSYLVQPFITKEPESMHAHSNLWECSQMAKTWNRYGYTVDVINWYDGKFRPSKQYDFFIDIHSNMERISPLLNTSCIKILHITGAHWLYQNKAEYERLLDLQRRRGTTLAPRRLVPPSMGIEFADCATTVGHGFSMETFRYANKPLHWIPLSTTVEFPWLEGKDFRMCRNRFLWIGSSGMVLKGLDLVLEAFAQMPECELVICGRVNEEPDFERAYWKELHETPNIRTIGWVDVTGPEFLEIAKSCIGLVYPSCSEGCPGSVILCMHASLIPIVSRESSVDVGNFGIVLEENTVEAILTAVDRIRGTAEDRLTAMARDARESARMTYTRERFAGAYDSFVLMITSQGRAPN